MTERKRVRDERKKIKNLRQRAKKKTIKKKIVKKTKDIELKTKKKAVKTKIVKKVQTKRKIVKKKVVNKVKGQESGVKKRIVKKNDVKRSKKKVVKKKSAKKPAKKIEKKGTNASDKRQKSSDKNKKRNSQHLMPSMSSKPIGEITHYFSKIKVVVVKVLDKKMSVGDTIWVKGKSTNFKQTVDSLQVESIDVKSAKKGKLVGLRVKKDAKPGDYVYCV